VTLKTSWQNVKAKTIVNGRHDNRHTLITDPAESGTGDETIRDIAARLETDVEALFPHPHEGEAAGAGSNRGKGAGCKAGGFKSPHRSPHTRNGSGGKFGSGPTEVPTVDRVN
jgi:hypothetical protein